MKKQLRNLFWLIPLIISCEDFLEIDPPKNQIIGEQIFNEASTVESALAHIYIQLRDDAITSGSVLGLSFLMGHYSDELEHLSLGQIEIDNMYNNSVLPSDSSINGLWTSSYNIIYDCNSILQGVENSKFLNQSQKAKYKGEAYFIRAIVHFYLINLFGDIPYIDSTDYRENSKVKRLDVHSVYSKLIFDLNKSKELLYESKADFVPQRPSHWTSSALLARVYLYSENWKMAYEEASYIITEGPFELEQEIQNVFLNGSSESLFYLDSGVPGTNTHEGNTFIAHSAPPSTTCLTKSLEQSFEEGDQRFINWVGSISDGNKTWYFPYKYKLGLYSTVTDECSILLRLAELYLIAAEANAQLGKLENAKYYLNIIRNRASLPSVSITDKNGILEAIYHERRVELFSELGHRFFDLKRTGKANEVLSLIKPNWEPTDIVLPIPEKEILKNPNLLPQNDGY